ncbi:hypothetical protein Mal64_35520 [Pseudobythopirellula maris]|uniref:Uncharacterized protein n=1 Tax=Pseudobythopirellula maris TaxID=2527991 RepID=A0A5C5ZJT9_9BACT|nr:hypothetical protein [Pseudobythopirellula maris]TWT86723.1 hypothetical protein Mal64_35520 [Pseudobythopirellula maris]
MTTNTNNQPVSEVRDGALKIAIFRNEPKQEGDRPRYSGKLTRSYRDANGEWHDTDYLSGTEFLRAARLMEKAYDEEIVQRAADKSASPEPSA